MSEINYDDFDVLEIDNLRNALIKSNLITKYDKDRLQAVEFNKVTINSLINKPRLIILDPVLDNPLRVVSEAG